MVIIIEELFDPLTKTLNTNGEAWQAHSEAWQAHNEITQALQNIGSTKS